MPEELMRGIDCLNINFLTEIRIRRGQPVIIEYRGEYVYINSFGVCRNAESALKIYDVDGLFGRMTADGVYAYAEQLKNSFITLDGGVRVGVAGEYVTERGCVQSVRGVTSLNIRIPHDVAGCADDIYLRTQGRPSSVLIFSQPGLGKTTMLRGLARRLSTQYNVLVFDERNEIFAADSDGDGYDLGARCDVVRGGDKLTAFACAIRAMKPQFIVTDELYGERDIDAVRYAADCDIRVCASTHVMKREILAAMPFDYYCRLTEIGGKVIIYDKNFNPVGDNRRNDVDRRADVGR